MLRIFAIAAILPVTIATARAETLAEKIHAAAVEACAVESAEARPASHYSTISAHCVDRISSAAYATMGARAQTRTLSSTARND